MNLQGELRAGVQYIPTTLLCAQREEKKGLTEIRGATVGGRPTTRLPKTQNVAIRVLYIFLVIILIFTVRSIRP